jgi:hypothetical protein
MKAEALDAIIGGRYTDGVEVRSFSTYFSL